MNASKVVPALLGVAAVFVIVVVSVLFFKSKGKLTIGESKAADSDADTQAESAGDAAAAVSQGKVLHVVSFLSDSRVAELKNMTDAYLLDARAKSNYSSNGLSVTVAAADLEDNPGYTKVTHTLSAPLKGTEVVFDDVARVPFFEYPLALLTVYLWHKTVLFMSFKTVNETGTTQFVHYHASKTSEGLRWSRFDPGHSGAMDPVLLNGKLDELNTVFGNVVAVHLDEFPEAADGVYTSEFGGTEVDFAVTKRRFTQAGFMKVTHKLDGNEAKPYKLKRVLVSDNELSDLVMPRRPVASLSVFWWYNMPLLAELELKGAPKDYFVYNLDRNNWYNEPVDKVRSTLTLLKNSLGVPLTLDLGKRPPTTGDLTYKTNEVLVRVTGPLDDSPTGFSKYTHRFATGKSQFLGGFTNLSTPQQGLPFARVSEVSVFFSEDVPLLVQLHLAGSAALSTTQLFFSNNGFGFWSKVMLGQTMPNEFAVLTKLRDENNKLMNANDKYSLDLAMKSDYLTYGKLVKVAKQNLSETLKGYVMFNHTKKGGGSFKFEKFVNLGKEVSSNGVTGYEGVTEANVYWFLDTPLLVHMVGSTPVAARTGTGASSPSNQGTPFNHFFVYNGETRKWNKLDNFVLPADSTSSGTNAKDLKLKEALDPAKKTLGSVTLSVGHGAGVYKTGPVTVTVTNVTSSSKYHPAVFDKMTHEMSAPFLLGKLMHFDTPVKTTHLTTTQASGGAGTQTPVDYPLDFPVYGMNVYVYKFVPLVVELFMEEGSTLLFKNKLAESKWEKFTPGAGADDGVGKVLMDLKAQLSTVSSLDVCLKHTADQPATYQLPRAVGTDAVQVTVAKMAEGVPEGLTGVAHTLPSHEKLSSLTCGQQQLTGLNLEGVKNVAVYLKNGVPTVVRTNSSPKYYTHAPDGGLKLHALPASTATTGLTDAQVAQLATDVSNGMGPVFDFNLETKTVVNLPGSKKLKVENKHLKVDWVLFTHTVGEAAENFTVSKFVKGAADAVGLPTNKLLNSVFVGMKGQVPKLVGLKTASIPVKYEWFVFDKNRWFFDFETDNELDGEELLAVLEDVEDGLENAFTLDLALDLTPEVFVFDHVKLGAELAEFAKNTYTVPDLKFPFWLQAVHFNSQVMVVPDLENHHLRSFTAYTYHGEPVLLHALTVDNKSLVFSGNFRGTFAAVQVAEFTEAGLKPHLLELKKKAGAYLALELKAVAGYKNYDVNVAVAQDTSVADLVFKKWVHKLPETQPAGGAATATPFTLGKVKFNGAPLDLTLPEGTMTAVNVFMDVDLPLGFHMEVTPPAPKPAAAAGAGAAGSGPTPVTTTTNTVSHHYVFFNDGLWAPMSQAAPLDTTKLKEKLTAAKASVVKRVYVDLSKRVTYSTVVETVNTSPNSTTTTTLSFLVEPDSKDVARLKAYTHVPKEVVVKTPQGDTGNMVVQTTTKVLVPFVTSFKMRSDVLSGFDLLKVDKLTVYWVNDSYPVLVNVKTASNSKFFKNNGDDKWVLVKTVPASVVLTEVMLFELANFAGKGFNHNASVELGAWTGVGNSTKYTDGQVTMRVVKSGNLNDDFKVYTHTSASVFSPTFVLDELLLYGTSAMKPVTGVKLVHEVKVFANADDFPLLAEVVYSEFKHPKAPLKYRYFKFNQDLADNGKAFVAANATDVKLNDAALLELLNPLKTVKDNMFFVDVGARKNYSSGTSALTVKNTDYVASSSSGTSRDKFDVSEHAFPTSVTKKSLVLLHGTKRVGFVTRAGGFKSVTVHWLNGLPLHAALKYETDQQMNYFFWNGGWTTELGVTFENYTNAKAFYDKLVAVHNSVELDVGKKTLTNQFGVVTKFNLEDFKPRGWELPDGLVGYSFVPKSDAHYKVARLSNFGADLDVLNLLLPERELVKVNVYSPDWFYAPLLVQFVTKVTTPQVKNVCMYFHVTSNGVWSHLDTNGDQLDGNTLALRLANVAFPAPVMVDVGKRGGVYGVSKLMVEKSVFKTTRTYTRYVHKLEDGENFLVARWLFGGLSLYELPVLKANHVAVYFYDHVPLLVEVNNLGLVKFFSPDEDGHWLQEGLNAASVPGFLDNLWYELSLFAKVSQEWVPHLNADFVREMELVPVVAKPVVSGAATPSTAAPSPPAEAVDRLGTSLPQPGAVVPPGGAAAAVPPKPASDSSVSQPQVSQQQSTPAQTTVPPPSAPLQTTPGVGTQSAAQVGAGGTGAVSSDVPPVSQPSAQTSPTALTQSTAVQADGASTGSGTSQPAGTQSTGQPVTGGTTAVVSPQTLVQPGTQSLGGQVPAAPAASVPQPTVSPQQPASQAVKPAAVVKPKREFKPLPFDYDELFHGYLTLGKMVKVSRFFTLPYGYFMSRHSFYNNDKYFANKFRLGVMEYKFPEKLLEEQAGERKVKSLAFYSWWGEPYFVKLGFDHKKPAYFTWNDGKTQWVETDVVNLEEELEHKNSLSGLFVFDLGAELSKHHSYFNNKFYYVSRVQDWPYPLFDALEFEALEKVQPAPAEPNSLKYTKVGFKLAKLRLNGVDYPSEGLPVGTVYHHMVAYVSKASNKPLMLVFYDDSPENDRKRFERENPGKFMGVFYQFNADGTWSKFLPEEAADALVKKLNELDALLALPWTLDLGKVTGAAAMLNYKANKADLVVERVFVPEPRPVAAAPPVQPSPGTAPPTGAPQGAPNGQGTTVSQAPANVAASNAQPLSTPVVPANGVSPTAPAAQPGASQAAVVPQPNLVTSQQPSNGTQGGLPEGGALRGGDTTGVVASSSTSSNGSSGSGPQTHMAGGNNQNGSTNLGQQANSVTVNPGPSQTQVTSTVGNGQSGALNAGQGTQATTLNTGNGGTSSGGSQLTQVAAQGTALQGNLSGSAPVQHPAGPKTEATPTPNPTSPGVGSPNNVNPQAAVNPNTSGMSVVETLTSGLVYVDVNFVAHPSPVEATEPEVGFEMYHHHHPYFVHRVGKTGANPPHVDTVKVKKFNLKKLVLNGADLVFERPFEPVVGGWAGMTVFYQKKVNTPFAFALFNPVENSGDLEKVAYDVWVYKNHKWVKTDALDAHYKLMRSLDLRAALGPLEQGLPAFYQKLQELAAEARGAHPRMFALDLAQQDKVKFGSVTVEKKVEVVNHLPLLKFKFQVKSDEGSASVDFTMENFSYHKNKFVGLHLPMPGVQTVEAYFRNPPAPYANYPQVLKLVQKLLKDGEVVVKHWFYGYMGFNEWNLLFVTEDALDDWDVLDLVNAKVYEYNRLAWMASGAVVADLDVKFPHVSNGRFLDARDFVYSPGVTHMPVPEGFVLYRFEMESENATFLLSHFKLQGDLKPTGFKWPLSQYFVYYRVGYATPFVVVFAQANNRTANPAHHWYYVNGFDLVRFKFANDVDPDAVASKDTVANKFKELLKTPPTSLNEDDPLKTVPSSTQPTAPTALKTNTAVLTKGVTLN